MSILKSSSPPGIAAWGKVPRRAQVVLEDEQTHLDVETNEDPRGRIATAGEQATAAAGTNNALKELGKAVKSLGAAGKQLIKAHHDAAVARAKATHHRHGAGAELHDAEKSASATRKAKREENSKAAFVYYSLRFFMITEIALLAIEMGFFYQVMSRDIDPRVAFSDPLRISAVLFAVFTPMAGVLAERFAGYATGRRLRAPADNTVDRRTQTIAMIAGFALLAVTSAALFAVVEWRYDTTTALTLSAGLPGWAMATLFVVVLWTLAFLRAFTADVTPLQVRPQGLQRLRQSSVLVDCAVIIADRTWAEAAEHMSTVIAQVITTIERVVVTTEDVIATSRAAHGIPLAATAASGTKVGTQEFLSAPVETQTAPALRVVHPGEAEDEIPTPTQPDTDWFPVPHIPERLWHVDLPLLNPYLVALRQAVQILTDYRPPIITPAARAKEVTAHLDTTAPETGDVA